jgi:hypothetical protein
MPSKRPNPTEAELRSQLAHARTNLKVAQDIGLMVYGELHRSQAEVERLRATLQRIAAQPCASGCCALAHGALAAATGEGRAA